MVKRKPARSPPVGTPTNSSIPARDGAVLPILHLNGFKIANPTVLARISRQELTELLRGYGYDPHFVEGDDPAWCIKVLPERSTGFCFRFETFRARPALPSNGANA